MWKSKLLRNFFFFFRFSNSLAKDMSSFVLMSYHLFRLNGLENQLVLNLRNCATTRTVYIDSDFNPKLRLLEAKTIKLLFILKIFCVYLKIIR